MFYNRTYFDKCATIIRNSNINTGFNPVSDLLYGRNNSRFLLYFNHNKIKKMVDDNEFPDTEKLKHYLKITNASSIDMSELHDVYGSLIDGKAKKRATSFDLIFFLIPEDWDNGKGFDYTKDYFNTTYYNIQSNKIDNYLSEDGATWYKPKNGYSWKNNIEYQKSTDEQITFFIKSDKKVIKQSGDIVTFTYTSCANGFEQIKNLKLKPLNTPSDINIIMGTPIVYSNAGYICSTEEEILKYGKYIKVTAKISENKSTMVKKLQFGLEYTVGDKTYKSNQYRIEENPKTTYTYPVTDDGIYSTDTLDKELIAFENGEDSIIIAKQHFDIGCENICVDITDTFNKFISGELENHGIAIAFSPKYEQCESNYENYVGLFTNRTNSFFEPYVETIYLDSIEDDRRNFVLGRKNKLYLYTNIGGNLVNLDQLPTCTVNETQYEVKQAGKGIYYIEITLPVDAFSSPTMLYDVWDGIMYHGENLKPVEMEFTTVPAYSFFNIGNTIEEKPTFTPTTYGINDGEIIKAGDIRKVCFLFKKDYAKNTAIHVDDVDVRLYVMDGTAQVTVIPYIKANRTINETYILIDTGMLIPNIYHMDLRVKYGMELIEHHDILKFTITNEQNNRYV